MDLFSNNECIVCGTVTTKRCSGCKQLAFCSAEHQKLLWSNHKHHCSCGFYCPPPPTDEELEWSANHPNPAYPIIPLPYNVQRLLPGYQNKTDRELCILGGGTGIASVRYSCYKTGFPGYEEGKMPTALLAFATISLAEGPIGLCFKTKLQRVNKIGDDLLMRLSYVASVYHEGMVLLGAGQKDESTRLFGFAGQGLQKFRPVLAKMYHKIGVPGSVFDECLEVLQSKIEMAAARASRT